MLFAFYGKTMDKMILFWLMDIVNEVKALNIP